MDSVVKEYLKVNLLPEGPNKTHASHFYLAYWYVDTGNNISSVVTSSSSFLFFIFPSKGNLRIFVIRSSFIGQSNIVNAS